MTHDAHDDATHESHDDATHDDAPEGTPDDEGGLGWEGLREAMRRVDADPLPSPDEAGKGTLAREASDDGTCPSCGATLEPHRTRPSREGADWRCPLGCDDGVRL